MGKEQEENRGGKQPEEYKARLLNKLNCLIAVLEVAIEKIKKSLASPEANVKRLTKIQENLENTLGICLRARETLIKKGGIQGASSACSLAPKKPEKREDLPPAAPERKVPKEGKNPAIKGVKMTFRDYVELSSIQEYKKFKKMPPIQPKEILKVDLDELIRKLMAG